MKIKEVLKKFWDFLQKDTWPSFAVTLLIAFVIIKFIFFPLLSLVTGSVLPLVIVESCSMHHYEEGFDKIFESDVYENYGISINDTKNWDFQNGFNKGDVIFVVGAKNLEVGDVIIFNSGSVGVSHPIIHRAVDVGEKLATKGDNYESNDKQRSDEKNISQDQLVGKALFRVPFIGWAKLIFYEGMQPDNNKGFCG